MSGRAWEEIVQIIESRRAARGPVIDMMIAVRDRYQADYVIPDPSGSSDDVSPVLTPALIAEAVDQPALRAASVIPNVFVPPLNPTKPTGRESLEFAGRRRGAILGAWSDSRLPLMLRRSFRQLGAYATTCFVVEADADRHMPMIQLRDPLSTFPEPKAPEDLSLPENAGFIYGKSGDWLRTNFPMAREENGGPIPHAGRDAIEDLWDVLEWVDRDVIVHGLLGPRYQSVSRLRGAEPVEADMELARFVNRAKCCPVVCPQTVTLDQIGTQIAKIIGHVDLQGQILQMDIEATQRAIYPDRFITQTGNNAPTLVGGTWKEGRTGEVNIILDGTISELRGDPGPGAERIQDRLERNARISSGLIPQMGGESGGTVPRTGRGLDTLGSWAVDPKVQELQELMQYALESLNEAVIETYVGYWPGRKYHVFYGQGGSGQFVEFTPSKELAEDHNSKVSYAIAGADKQGTTVQLGQQIGAGLISHHTARQKHPDIDDAELEGRLIREEQMDDALATAILQRATQGGPDGIAPEDAAKIRASLREGLTLDAAVLKVDEERKNAQAAEQAGQSTPPGQPTPDQPGAGAQPGLASPLEGAGSGVPQAGVQPPGQPLQNLQQLVRALRTTSH